jgi:uncharacterized protein (DUF934 family)
MPLFKNGALIDDAWQRLADTQELPQAGQLLLSVDQWRKFAPLRQRANVAYGLMLEPGAAVEDFADVYESLGLVAINFPKFTDGRGYSMGRRIRQRFAYAGEMRATGDILFDQLQFLTRCGFDAFEIVHEPTLRLLKEGHKANVSHFYQPAIGGETPSGGRPWARRPNS